MDDTVSKAVLEDMMTSLRAELEAKYQREAEERRPSPLDESNDSESQENSRAGIFLIQCFNQDDSGVSSLSIRSPLAPISDSVNNGPSQRHNEESINLRRRRKVKDAEYWSDLFKFSSHGAWLDFRVTYRHALLIASVL